MRALRIIRTVEEDSILITHLQEFKGKTVELIILPLENEEAEWAQLNINRLSSAYSLEEPDYTIEEVKEINPDYEAG